MQAKLERCSQCCKRTGTDVYSKRRYFGFGFFFNDYVIRALSTCPKSLPDPVLSSTSSNVSLSGENSPGEKYKIRKALAPPLICSQSLYLPADVVTHRHWFQQIKGIKA